MALVEVVAGERSDPAVVERAVALVEAWGKDPVRSTDSPGFIVNRVNRPFTIEALRMLEADEASVEAIDQAMREAGFPMGPFELMDLVGVDVNLAAARAVWEGLGRPDRLRPSPIQERLVAAGRLGRKSGSGFYRYDEGRRAGVDDDFASTDPGASAGEIRERILAAVAAEANRARDDGVATAADIERALKLGAAHPGAPSSEPDCRRRNLFAGEPGAKRPRSHWNRGRGVATIGGQPSSTSQRIGVVSPSVWLPGWRINSKMGHCHPRGT